MHIEPRRLTSGPAHHFFGYYGISVWDRSGRRHLALETDFHRRPPVPEDRARVGLVDAEDCSFTALAATGAFNLQQGSMLHWIDAGHGEELTYNTWRGGRVVSQARALLGGGLLPEDGHACFSPDGRWLVCDTYPQGAERISSLMLYEMAAGRRVDIGGMYSEPLFTGDVRCDLHPRWHPDGRSLTIDAVPDGNRQIYQYDVSPIVD